MALHIRDPEADRLVRESARRLGIGSTDVVNIDLPDADRALEAAARFGKSSGHPARLDTGDCFAYAAAANRGPALLFKGDDFGLADIGNARGSDSLS